VHDSGHSHVAGGCCDQDHGHGHSHSHAAGGFCDHDHGHSHGHEAGGCCDHDHGSHGHGHEAGGCCDRDHGSGHSHGHSHEAGSCCGHDHGSGHGHSHGHEARGCCDHGHSSGNGHGHSHEAGGCCGHDHGHAHAHAHVKALAAAKLAPPQHTALHVNGGSMVQTRAHAAGLCCPMEANLCHGVLGGLPGVSTVQVGGARGRGAASLWRARTLALAPAAAGARPCKPTHPGTSPAARTLELTRDPHPNYPLPRPRVPRCL
jgi:hypothetical protein